MKKSKLPQKLWFVESKEYLKTIQSKGIYNHHKKQKFIHDLSFKIGNDEFSVSDYLAVNNYALDNQEYVLLEIDTSSLDFKIRKCHTEGMVISQSVYHIDVFHIPPSSIKGYEMKNIKLDDLIFANSQIIWETMNLEPKPKNNSYFDPRVESFNNRILNDRRQAKDFNNKLFRYIHGDFESNYFKGLFAEREAETT